jgi:crotonobetainyl-CoA:carnitine CoA-transferase CaiB-like acyl-CoA transferase
LTKQLQSTTLLKGIRIIEIGKSDTLHGAGMLLADQGAEVLRFESGNEDEQPTFHRTTDRSKRSVQWDPHNTAHMNAITRLIARSDIVLEDWGPLFDSTFTFDPDSLSSVIRCTILPYKNEPAPESWSEESVSAFSGLYENAVGIGGPRFYDLPVAATLGSLYTVYALATALIGRARSGSVDRIVVPLDRVIMFSQVLTTMIRSKAPRTWEPFRMLASPFMGPWKTAGNEYIYVHIGMPRHLRSFLFLLDKIGFSPEKKELKSILDKKTKRDPVLLGSVREALTITRILKDLFLNKNAMEWEELLGNTGLCCTKIRSFEEWRSHPQVTQSQEIIDCLSPDGKRIEIPGPVFVSSNDLPHSVAPAISGLVTIDNIEERWPQRETVRIGKNDRPPLDGIRVLDLSRVIAGPFAGRLLAEAGAQVVHLSLRKSHLMWEEPFHVVFNAGKDSVVLDYAVPEAKAIFKKILVDFKPDIILHNFLDDAAEKIGCDYDTCKRINDKIIYVDIKGYNQRGPWARRPGFEQNVQAASGILSTYSKGGAPRILPVPVNDMSSGLIAAFGAILSLMRRHQTQQGNRITSFLSMPSILMHLRHLDKKGTNENSHRYFRYFKASDRWLFFAGRKEAICALVSSSVATMNVPDFEQRVAHLFRKKPMIWWQRQLGGIPQGSGCSIVPRRTVSKILKYALAQTDPLFSYKSHKGFGMVLFARSPIDILHLHPGDLSCAPCFGGDTARYVAAAGFDPARFSDPVSEVAQPDRVIDFLGRIGWLIKQGKWLAAIACRLRGLNK